MDEVIHKISVTEAKIEVAELNGEIDRRNNLETYLVELQRNKNILLQQQAPAAPAPGNYLIL